MYCKVYKGRVMSSEKRNYSRRRDPGLRRRRRQRELRRKLTLTGLGFFVIIAILIVAVVIQKGKDMLTLITCHPYRHNHKRYVVFCEKR